MDESILDEKMRELAGRQHAVVGREQLRALGATRQAARRREVSTDWEPVTRRVLRLAGAPVTDRQRAMAAVLDAGAGALLSHASAAALWGLAGFDLGRLEVTRARRGPNRSTSLARLHHPIRLPAHHATERDGIPVTTLARTVADLAATEHVLRVERAAHAAVRMGLTWAALAAVHDELPAHRPGIRAMRALLAANAGLAPLGSGLEGTVLRLLADAGLPAPRRQVDLGGDDWIGRVDFYFGEARLVLEVDGQWCHAAPPDVLHDGRRTAALEEAGFRVLRVPEAMVRDTPGEVARLVRRALAGVA
ncbi:MAG TPA: DUF559 domain-containing protein [Acidimicrobiales bacterium]|nr:DUF559 domain-containing protein [Acidimicrobiales bacterium]